MGNDTRPFPIQAEHGTLPSTIPWWLAEVVYDGYAKRSPGSAASQSLEEIAKRGGFGRYETVYLIQQATKETRCDL